MALSFSPGQIAALRDARRCAFVSEMVAHCRLKFPRITNPLSDDALEDVVWHRLKRAKEAGLKLRGSTRLFLELTLVFGAEFDSDPLLPWARDIIAAPPEVAEPRRARKLFDAARAYLLEVHGPGGRHAVEALRALEPLAASGFEALNAAQSDWVTRRWLVETVFPRKASDAASLDALFACADRQCAALGFARPRDAMLVTALMIAFGHGCFGDRAQPWIAQGLAGHQDDGEGGHWEQSAERLRRRAVAWLRTVNAGREGMTWAD